MAAEAFRDTLPSHERHFVARLESFGDIVVGFSMSLLGLQLTVPHTAAELYAHPIRFAAFFGTFAIVSAFWVRFHRIMATGFAPARTDVFLAFAYLAFVALTPYAMLVNVSLSFQTPSAVAGLGFYLAVFLGVTICGMVLDLRATRRGWPFLDEPRRRSAWGRLVASAVVLLFLSGGLAGVLAGQAAIAALSLTGLVVAAAVARRVLREPRPAWLGITAASAGTPAPQAVS